MSRGAVLASVLLLLSLSGCYRTHYVNIQPAGDELSPVGATRSDVSGRSTSSSGAGCRCG